MSTLLSLFLIGFIQTGSVGFMHDPLVEGVSLKFGAEKGLRAHLMISFSSGENLVDSSQYIYPSGAFNPTVVYDTTFYREYSWINLGARAEYYLMNRQWFQPYFGIGIGGRKESRWQSDYRGEVDTINTYTPEKVEANYWGPTVSTGIDFYPISLYAKIRNSEIPFAKAISLTVEICSYYLIKHDFKGVYLAGGWFGFYPEHTFSGISSGVGIHYNW